MRLSLDRAKADLLFRIRLERLPHKLPVIIVVLWTFTDTEIQLCRVVWLDGLSDSLVLQHVQWNELIGLS